MNLLFLEEVATSIVESTSEATSTSASEVVVHYTDLEIVLWYIIFAVTLFIFIMFIRKRGNGNKQLTNVTNKINKEISAFDVMIKSVSLSKSQKKVKYKDTTSKTNIALDYADTVFISFKEKTHLNDFDRLLSASDKIRKKIKKLQNLSRDDTVKQLKDIQMDLIKLKGQIDLVAPLVK